MAENNAANFFVAVGVVLVLGVLVKSCDDSTPPVATQVQLTWALQLTTRTTR